jgi:hypothetical protein
LLAQDDHRDRRRSDTRHWRASSHSLAH